MKNIYLFRVAATAMVMSLSALSYGQGMAVNTSGVTADASAILDASSTTQGVLVPRMTDVQRAGISNPATGLLVYQTNGAAGFYYNSGTPGAPVWVSLNALSNVTTQGNSFNGASQLVQMTGSAKLPVIDGSQLTALTPTNLTGSGQVPAAAMPAFTGDVITSAGAVSTTLGSSATTGNRVVTAINNASTGTISTARLGTGTTSSTTFLNGSGTWSTPLTLTTTGSGAATFSAGVLNIPTPSGGGGTSATGASPSGIPYSVNGRPTTSTFFYSPGSSTQTTTLGPTTCSIAPTTCTPSMTIYTYNSNAITWNLKTVTVDGTGTYTVGTTVMSCATSASSGGVVQTCTATAGATVPAGTLLSLVPSVTPSGGAGFYLAFSCQ